jgi:hypothetical protein
LVLGNGGGYVWKLERRTDPHGIDCICGRKGRRKVCLRRPIAVRSFVGKEGWDLVFEDRWKVRVDA